ncbi:hypothetical protein MPSEU_000819200 [Mayamaea pseudoterrestris]|nr:hypothetical protein MPSEU_000819200 [Mayamaea pseudoterrestris]
MHPNKGKSVLQKGDIDGRSLYEPRTLVQDEHQRGRTKECPFIFGHSSVSLDLGAFTNVRVGVRKDNATERAVKGIDLRKVYSGSKWLPGEVANLQALKGNDHIVKLFGVYPVINNICFLEFERLGQNLLDFLLDYRNFSEKRIVLRDLRLENFMLLNQRVVTSGDETLHFKIGRFGSSKVLPLDGTLQTLHGKGGFICPEMMVGRTYDMKCDVWSMGSVACLLLGGELPFGNSYDGNGFLRTLLCELKFESEFWPPERITGKAFVADLLGKNPFTRPDAAASLKLPWMSARSGDLGTSCFNDDRRMATLHMLKDDSKDFDKDAKTKQLKMEMDHYATMDENERRLIEWELCATECAQVDDNRKAKHLRTRELRATLPQRYEPLPALYYEAIEKALA